VIVIGEIDEDWATPENLFEYGEEDLCQVTVYGVIWGDDVPLHMREVEEPTKEQWVGRKTYNIHRGYLRVIMGFLREISLMFGGKVKEHNCLFRGTYLTKILDHFAAELPSIVQGAESRWRSRTLNPLLQRQIRGLADQEPGQVEVAVGKTLEAAADFYLTLDPLHPNQVKSVLRYTLYVWQVRWSLRYLTDPMPGQSSYTRTRNNTVHLFNARADISDEEHGAVALTKEEVKLIVEEGIERFYLAMIAEAGLQSMIERGEQ